MTEPDEPAPSYTDIFEEVCPYYLAIGMTMREYWDGPPRLARYYREAHRLKMEEDNQKAWMQGLYIKAALDASLSSIFGKKGSKKGKYLDKPLEIFEKREREKKDAAIRERQKAIDYFNGLIKAQKKARDKQNGNHG